MSADSTGVDPDVVRFQPPTPAQMRAFFRLARWYFDPEFLGLWELDLKRPALFVGNHTLYGLTDAPLMIEHLYTHYGVMLRGLGDRGHFNVPGWGGLLKRHGMVLGTPENCSALMKSGQSILVFPGGGREVMRRKGEAYRLIWKQRAGFARMAVEHGYDIIPFGSVGPDEGFKILLDGNDVTNSRVWKWLAARTKIAELTRGGDMLPPIARGLGPTLIPRPQRFYFGFGPRISTAHVQGRHQDKDVVWSIREDVARAVEHQIERLIRYRADDRLSNWSPVRRWLAPLDPAITPAGKPRWPPRGEWKNGNGKFRGFLPQTVCTAAGPNDRRSSESRRTARTARAPVGERPSASPTSKLEQPPGRRLCQLRTARAGHGSRNGDGRRLKRARP